jgi:hypothetical protein
MVLLPRRGALIAAAALAAAVLTGCGSGGSNTRRPGQPRAPTVVTVLAGKPGRTVPYGFVGLSVEYRSVEAYAGDDPSALDPVFVQLVRNLAPGQTPVLRIGGDSSDRAWWPTPGIARPPGVKFAITDRWLAVTRALVAALGARVIAGLNLEANSPALAASEGRALIDGIGRGATRALELGNEPDLYATFPWYRTPGGRHVKGRPRSYDMSGLIGDFTRFASALPPALLAGPSLGAPDWARDLGRFLTAEPRVGLVTLHRYPLQRCYTHRNSPRYPTLAHLLSPASSIGLADSFARYVRVAHAHGRSVRIDELNSVSCGAVPKVSNTFASALWVLNTLFEMARVGIHGVNVHTFPGAGYELFRVRRTSAGWEAEVAPEYYGLEMFASAAPAGSRLLAVTDGSDSTLHTWATRTRDGIIRVLCVNTGTGERVVRVGVARPRGGAGGDGARQAEIERLTAPSLRSSDGVSLGRQTFGPSTSTGVLAGAPEVSPVSPVDGRYAVPLPGGSAALLTLTPPASP